MLWGAYHALLFVPLLVMNKNRRYRDDERHIQDVPKMLITFVLLVIGWVVFRSPSITACGEYFMGICDSSLLTMPYIENTLHLGVTLLAIIAMLIIEWRKLLPNRWWIYYMLIIAIWWFAGQDIDFIYFQF